MSTISASTTSTTAFKITTDTTGALVFQTGASPTTALTLDTSQNAAFGGGAGTQSLTVTSSGTAAYVQTTGAGAVNARLQSNSTTAQVGTLTNHNFVVQTNSNNIATFDTSGNFGLGVTPSAWRSTDKAIQLGSGAASMNITASGVFNSGWNFYINSSGQYIYAQSDYASLYRQGGAISGAHQWFTAGSGTAGNAISFTQAMTLDASGNLLIGTTSSDLSGGGVTTRISTTNATGYAATNVNTGTAAYAVYQLGNNNTANRAGTAVFGSGYTSSGLYRQDGLYLYCNGSGGITISAENTQPIYFATNNTERARFNAGAPILCLSGGNTSATGTGIAFPASQNASTDANTLDDYEEGSWTPVFYGSGGAGSFSATSANGGRYVKIGMLVICWANVTGTLTGASGDMNVSGLPFASATTGGSGGNSTYSTGALQYWAGISVSPMGPLIFPGTTNLYFHTYQGSSAGASGVSPAVVNGVSQNCHFFVAYYTVA